MALPRVIEYLLAQTDEAGGALVTGGVSQIVTIVPPAATITFRVVPAINEYFQIYYKVQFDPAMMPNAFYGYVQYFGRRLCEGFLTGSLVNYPLEFYSPCSNAIPCLIYIRNTTPLNQYYASESFYLGIQSLDTYNQVVKALLRLETSRESQEMAAEARELIQKLEATIQAGGLGNVHEHMTQIISPVQARS